MEKKMKKEQFNWQKEHLGKHVVSDSGKIGKFIARCDESTFDVEWADGTRIGGAIGSPLGTGWKLADKRLNSFQTIILQNNATFWISDKEHLDDLEKAIKRARELQ